MATSINIADITSNVSVDANNIVTGDGYFDDLMETINKHLQAQYDKGYIQGEPYTRAYVALAQSALAQAMQFSLSKRTTELRADIAEQELLKKIEEATIAQGTTTDKIAQVSAQLAKTEAETSYIDEQETQLINSVEFNNKIKSADALADVYGTFGAGGLTLSSDMWATFFSIINDLSSADVPTSTTVTKVT